MKRDEGMGSRTGTLLLAAGIGAAVMYFLDPGRGARRRAIARDRTRSVLRTGADELERRAEDARNRVSGALSTTRSRFRRETPDDDRLVARVRAELGHHTEQAGHIEVLAENGTVTLRGRIPEEERGELLRAARKVRGVQELRDELEVEVSGNGSTGIPARG
ncbi:MAG TPA: BON domain-containing protein [Gemmatimonadales bacterium]|nr:BON domain-containing protein [Gemmatimonadales bacterium]